MTAASTLARRRAASTLDGRAAPRRPRFTKPDRAAAQPRRLRRRARRAAGVGPTTRPARPPTSTGTPRSRSATTSGRGASASPTRWTPPSATWAWTAAATRELIARSAAEARVGRRRARGRRQHRPRRRGVDLARRGHRRLHGAAALHRGAGAGVVLMASRHLARAATSADDYERVYREVLGRGDAPRSCCTGSARRSTRRSPATSARPTGADGIRHAARRSSASNADKVARRQDEPAGCRRRDRACARGCPRACAMFTGDDFNYVGLIEGDGAAATPMRCSARSRPSRPNASAAIQALDAGDPDRYRAHPRPDRGAGAAGLRRADLLLQDRRRVPVLAQRPPAGVPDGRRPALGAQPAAPVAHRRLAERVGRARAARARRRSAGTRCCALNGVDVDAERRPRRDRASAAVAQPGDDQVRRPRRPRCGSTAEAGVAGDRPVARAGRRGRPRRRPRSCSPTPGCASRRLCRGGFFTAARGPARAAPRSTTTGARSRRPRPSPLPARTGRPRCSCSSPAGCPTARATWSARASACATRSASWSPDAAAAGCHARDRAAASDVRLRPRRRLDARSGARHRRATFDAAVGRRRRRHVPRLVGPRRARRRSPAPGASGRIATLPGVRLDDPARRPTCCSPRHYPGDGVIDFAALTAAVSRRGLHAATSRWRSSTRRSGTPTPRERRRDAPPRPSTPTSVSDLSAAAPRRPCRWPGCSPCTGGPRRCRPGRRHGRRWAGRRRPRPRGRPAATRPRPRCP